MTKLTQPIKPIKPIELAIVIVNWNAGELLRECIESIRRNPPRVDYEILVVDNASSDGSVRFLQEGIAGDNVRLILNNDNRGFAKANNQAIAASSAPLLFLLNPDTKVQPGAINVLLESIQSEPRMGACAPRLLNTDGSLQPSVWPAPPRVTYILLDGLRLYALLPKTLRAQWLMGTHWDHSTRRRVPFFWGAAMMVRREMIEDVGPLDESFEMYGEDCEWCVRMGRGGWSLYFEPAAGVVHYGGHSATKRWTNDEVWLLKIKTNIRFQQRVLPRFNFLLNQLAYALVMIVTSAKRFLCGEAAKGTVKAARIHLGYVGREIASLFSAGHGNSNAQREARP